MPSCMRNPRTLNIIVNIEACFAGLYRLATISRAKDMHTIWTALFCISSSLLVSLFRLLIVIGKIIQIRDPPCLYKPTTPIQFERANHYSIIYWTRKYLHIAGLNRRAGYAIDLLANLLYCDQPKVCHTPLNYSQLAITPEL